MDNDLTNLKPCLNQLLADTKVCVSIEHRDVLCQPLLSKIWWPTKMYLQQSGTEMFCARHCHCMAYKTGLPAELSVYQCGTDMFCAGTVITQ